MTTNEIGRTRSGRCLDHRPGPSGLSIAASAMLFAGGLLIGSELQGFRHNHPVPPVAACVLQVAPAPPAVVATRPVGETELWRAICEVESNHNSNAVGDGGKAAGIAQIWCVVVDDCNRILGRQEFSDADRWSVERSRQMFSVYTKHYCGSNWTPERAARIWNGGPRGNEKQGTLVYWSRVQQALERSRG